MGRIDYDINWENISLLFGGNEEKHEAFSHSTFELKAPKYKYVSLTPDHRN